MTNIDAIIRETAGIEPLRRRRAKETFRSVYRIDGFIVKEFDDFPALMQVIEYVRLGEGEKAEKAEKLLGVSGRPAGHGTCVEIGDASMAFEDILLHLRPESE